MPESRDSVSPPPSKRRKLLETQRQGGESSTSTSDYRASGNPERLVIYSWNVNGIGPFIQRCITSFFKSGVAGDSSDHTSAVFNIRDVLRRYHWPTFFLIQEAKISLYDQATKRAVEKAALRASDESADHPSYKAYFCLPSDPYNARGFGRKLYGVVTLIRADFASAFVERVREVEWDAEGRFLVCDTKAFGRFPKLAIINVYAVNGTDAPYKDPMTGKIIGTRHDRKLQVHVALQAECQKLESEGRQVILAGDLNIARSRLDAHPNLRTRPEQHCFHRADFESRFFCGPTDSSTTDDGGSGLGMIDSFRYAHPQKAGYTYYPRGMPFGSSCDRVDMILVSRSLEPRLVSAGIEETPADRGPSDHVPLYSTLE